MPQGLQIWDESGNIVLDLTDNFTRLLGSVYTNFANGRHYDANLLQGRPWFEVIAPSESSLISIGFLNVYVSDGTLVWTHEATARYNYKIVYGVY